MAEQYTPEALAALDADIEAAERRHREALLSMGDDSSHETWHDNPAFEQAKQQVDMASSVLRRLKSLRKNAVLVERAAPGAVIDVGSTVVLRLGAEAEPMTVHIAGHYVRGRSDEERDVLHVSTESPLGGALLGHVQGDTVEYASQTGKRLSAIIDEVIG